VIVVELTTVNDETEFAPNFTDVAFEKSAPVMVTVDPNAAELVEFRLVLANDVIEGAGVLSEVTLTEFKPVT
jgi:hypothetical protein